MKHFVQQVLTEIEQLKAANKSVYGVANKIINAYKRENIYSWINRDLVNYQIKKLKEQEKTLENNNEGFTQKVI